ncbi:MAG TPA: DNA glycosylase [Thermotogota bacterium]|nr:DNA glycosylase [Thermotogota bacterium]HRW34089.1 DNA glycosylase [Thermotogota bacterium]
MKTQIPINVSLDLERTFHCGQTFRWHKKNGEWFGVVNGVPLILFHDQFKGVLHITSNTHEIQGEDLENGIIHYLGLNDSLQSIKENAMKRIEKSYPEFQSIFERIMDTTLGIRILRQDPWEMLVEYLLSTQSNIATIKKRCECLVRVFPENHVLLGEDSFYLFPSVEQLKTLDENHFRSMQFGYRSGWLKEMIETIDIKAFKALKQSTLEQKLDYLTRFSGVGYKVANCVALFGFSDFRAFPVDVWISRFLNKYFELTGNSESLMYAGQEIFGRFCGYVQEYIFYYIRTGCD